MSLAVLCHPITVAAPRGDHQRRRASDPQPGTYLAALNFASNHPVKPNVIVPVTLTVSAPAGWGKINGRVLGLAACDVNPAPQAAYSSLLIESSGGMTWTLKPDTLGNYQLWLDAVSSPLTLTASIGSGYVPQSAVVNVTANQTTTTNLNLRPIAPCQQVNPASLASTQRTDQMMTQTLTISNSGASNLTWTANTAASATNIWQAGNVTLDGGFENTIPVTHGNLYWTQTSTRIRTCCATPPTAAPCWAARVAAATGRGSVAAMPAIRPAWHRRW